MSHIFISYSHTDSDYAHSLAEALEQKGFSVWIDDRIDYGTQWPREIEKHLDDCSAFIVIMTPRSRQSKWVNNELSRAQRKGKPVFPLLLEGDEPWLEVETTQYVDVRGNKLPPPNFYTRLAQVAQRRKTAPSKTSSPSPAKPSRPTKKSVPKPTTEYSLVGRWVRYIESTSHPWLSDSVLLEFGNDGTYKSEYIYTFQGKYPVDYMPPKQKKAVVIGKYTVDMSKQPAQLDLEEIRSYEEDLPDPIHRDHLFSKIKNPAYPSFDYDFDMERRLKPEKLHFDQFPKPTVLRSIFEFISQDEIRIEPGRLNDESYPTEFGARAFIMTRLLVEDKE